MEIGGIEVVNYRANKKIAHLPFARIEKIREGNLTVIVKDNLFRGDEKRNEIAQWTRVASRRRGAYGLWLSFDVRIHVF